MNLVISVFTARIEDEDSDFDDEWMVEERTNRGTVSYPLDPVRYWATSDAVNEDLTTTGGRCLGIQCNIWKRAIRRRDLRHMLCGASEGASMASGTQPFSGTLCCAGIVVTWGNTQKLLCFREKLLSFSLNFKDTNFEM